MKKILQIFLPFLIASTSSTSFAYAQKNSGVFSVVQLDSLSPGSATSADQNIKEEDSFFSFKTKAKRRYILLPALGSFILPGLDQWATAQISSGALYSTYALAGYYGAYWMNDKIKKENIGNPETENESIPLDPSRQFLSVAGQATLAAGFLSAYHSFRTYAEVSGDTKYDFIKSNGDTVEDIMLAPFKFKFLMRSTTFIPLLLGGALVLAGENTSRKMNSSDKGFILATSYQAGVGEEAFFRGFMYPYLTVSTGSNFWGNVLSSAIFGAMHISSENPYPVFQTAFGMYDAYVTKKNNWSIQESIFAHFWWDVIVIGAAIAKDTENKIHHRKTLLNLTF